MIDVEDQIFLAIQTKLYDAFGKPKKTSKGTYTVPIYVSGEYQKMPSSFPYVSVMEIDNASYERTRDSASNENHVAVVYQVDVYSNKDKGRKKQCKEILAVVDKEMEHLGFTRTMQNPMPNLEDATVFRFTARYRAVVSKDEVIYRR